MSFSQCSDSSLQTSPDQHPNDDATASVPQVLATSARRVAVGLHVKPNSSWSVKHEAPTVAPQWRRATPAIFGQRGHTKSSASKLRLDAKNLFSWHTKMFPSD